MAEISDKKINKLREFMDRGCTYAGTQDVVDDLVSKTLKKLGSKYPYGDEVGLIDVECEFGTVSEFANIFWDEVVIIFLNLLIVENRGFIR